jgi:ABC-type sulfate transport system permease subunit
MTLSLLSRLKTPSDPLEGGRNMIDLIIAFALFFLVLFVLLPVMMIFAMLMREYIHQYRKHSGWHLTHHRGI